MRAKGELMLEAIATYVMMTVCAAVLLGINAAAVLR